MFELIKDNFVSEDKILASLCKKDGFNIKMVGQMWGSRFVYLEHK